MKNIILSASAEREILRKIASIREQMEAEEGVDKKVLKSKDIPELLRTYKKLWTLIE